MPGHVLIVGSAPVDSALVAAVASSASAVICADGGAAVALEAGITPSLVVGDMDSIPTRSRERIESLGVRMVRYPPSKAKTDLELAIDAALALAPARISVLGALGGMRTDHAVGNIMLLTLPALRMVDVRLLTARSQALVVWRERTIHGRAGEYVSLLPITARVVGVRTSGLKYALDGESLRRGATRGVSNELLGGAATVEVRGGCLLVIHERLLTDETREPEGPVAGPSAEGGRV